MSLRLRKSFAEGRAEGRALFLPYICVGYPGYRASLEAARGALRAGASALELGVPFSDPIADGPALQAATHAALVHGARFRDVFRLIRELRKDGSRQPLLVMTYLNLVERMGWKKFVDELSRAGGDGVIVPDLPMEEFGPINALLKKKDLGLIPFLSPTSSPARAKMADAQRAPFLYYVSVTGVTGARKALASGLLSRLKALRKGLKTPLVVGFGISTPAQAATVGKSADGVIIASAMIQLLSRSRPDQAGHVVESFCRRVVNALRD